MIKNYIKIAFRTLVRNKAYALINILGLAIGISFSCMLYMYVDNELSYDTFHEKSDRIYRTILIDKRAPDQERKYAIGPPPQGQALMDDYPEVVNMVRLHQFSGHIDFKKDGQRFQERSWFTTTDTNFFEIFDFEFVAGDPKTALSEPFSVVLTENTAKKYFGNENPIGKTLTEAGGEINIKVTGMVKNHPDNSHLKFDMLLSNIRSDDGWKNYMTNWRGFRAYTYIVLDENADIESLKAKMPDFQQKYFGPMASSFTVDFQPIEDIYFGSDDIEFGVESNHGQMSYVYIFSAMAVFLLLIASINYINLATAKAMFRAKEIGIRKVVGAFKKQLVTQFLTESFIITLVALVLSVGILDLIFPFFNEITGKAFDLNWDNLPVYLLPLLGIAVVIGLFSGSYPAFYLSRLQPVNTIRGDNQTRKGSFNLRKVLVVFQFILSIVMIVSTLVIGQQLNYIQDSNLGFDKEQLMVIDINNGNVRRQFKTIRQQYANIASVQSVGVSSRVPGEWKSIVELYAKSSGSRSEGVDSVRTYFMGFDEGMLDTYGFQLADGDYFSGNDQTDSTKILLNETAVEAFGLDDPIGASIVLNGRGRAFNATVIGVLRDFNFQSMHQKIAPIIIGAWNNPFQSVDYFTLKIAGKDIANVISAATEVHEKFDQRTSMEYHYIDEQLNLFYVAEKRASMIFQMGAGLSIFVACLGLFGLASYTIQKRTKELGIRKVMGASEWRLFGLLSSSFVKQVGIAFVIASPFAYWIMNNWLSTFEYSITLGAGIFIISGVLALLIALLTVSYRLLKAVNANPVKALRTE